MQTKQLNKVLNRPLFRDEALKKGDLKPIKAQYGIMVGTNGLIDQPYVQKGGGFYDPRTNRLVGGLPANPNQPLPRMPLGARIRQGLGNFVGSFVDPTKKSFFLRPKNIPYLTGAVGAYDLAKGAGMSDTSAGLLSLIGGLGPQRVPLTAFYAGEKAVLPALTYGARKGIDYLTERKPGDNVSRIFNVDTARAQTPDIMTEAAGFGMGETVKPETVKPKAKKFDVRSITQKKSDIEAVKTDVEGLDIDAVGDKRKPDPQLVNFAADEGIRIAKETGVSNKRGSNIAYAVYTGKIAPNEVDKAAKDNIFYAQNTDNKFQDPKHASYLNIAPEDLGGPKPTKAAVAASGNPKKVGDGKVDQNPYDSGTANQTTNIKGTQVSGGLLGRAREIAAELGKGRTSNANLVFLANLAAGLMSGKTTKGGIGGALEVFVNALNPAVSNYAIMKLKEDEIENKIMGDALDAAATEMAAIAKGQKLVDAKPARVQFTDANGVPYNYEGVITKDGRTQLVTPRGNITVTAGQEVDIGNGQKLTVVRTMEKSKISAEEMKDVRALTQRNKSLNILNDAKEIIERTATAGLKGKVALIGSRLKSAAEDFGIGGKSIDDVSSTFFSALEKGYKAGDISKEKYDSIKKKFSTKNLTTSAKNRLKAALGDTDITPDELEKLVVAEVTLTYALANSFKDNDRLTGRDIDAADRVVGIFPLMGGSTTVLAKLKALEEDLIRDTETIKDRLRRQHFVVESVIQGLDNQLKYKYTKQDKKSVFGKVTKEKIEGTFKDF